MNVTREQVGKAIARWRLAPPTITVQRIAEHTERSIPTVNRWLRGMAEPTISEFLGLEALREGLLVTLVEGCKPPRKRAARRRRSWGASVARRLARGTR